MTNRHWEYLVVGLLAAVILTLLVRATVYARQEVRDDLRKQDLTNIKRALEQYFNAHEQYIGPTAAASQSACTTSDDTNSWLFGTPSPLLQEKFITAMPHDVREQNGHHYRYCTSVANGQAAGFVLEAQLESAATPGIFFDEDEQRKFHYRILENNGQTIYRLCGGDEPSCTPPGDV